MGKINLELDETQTNQQMPKIEMLIEIFFQFRCYLLQYLLYNMKKIACDINLCANIDSWTFLKIYQLVYKEKKNHTKLK